MCHPYWKKNICCCFDVRYLWKKMTFYWRTPASFCIETDQASDSSYSLPNCGLKWQLTNSGDQCLATPVVTAPAPPHRANGEFWQRWKTGASSVPFLHHLYRQHWWIIINIRYSSTWVLLIRFNFSVEWLTWLSPKCLFCYIANHL